jgi:hypothetical protein
VNLVPPGAHGTALLRTEIRGVTLGFRIAAQRLQLTHLVIHTQ